MAECNMSTVIGKIFVSDETNWKPTDKVPLITKELEQLKNELKSFLNNSTYDIADVLRESQELSSESIVLLDEMITCKDDIEKGTMAEILQSIENHDMLAKELKAVSFAIGIIYDFLQCSRYLKEYEAGQEAHSYPRMVEAAYDMVLSVDNPKEGFNCLDVYDHIKHAAQVNLDTLLDDLYEEWNRLASWSVKLCYRKTVVTIILNMDESYSTTDVLNSLDKCKKLNEKVMELSEFLMKQVLVQIMHNDCTVYAETEELMTITIVHKHEEYKPPYIGVIANLRILFHYLSNKLNIEFNRDRTIMTMIGKFICEEFGDILIEDCLKDTVPNNIIDLQTYGMVTSEIENFQDFLIMIKFFPPGFSILKYVADLDFLFAEKSSEYFLETARNIMFKDLSVTMSIGLENVPDDQAGPSDNLDVNDRKAIEVLDKTIPNSLFYFPRCLISKSAQELFDLTHLMMEQAVQCSDIVCKKLYITTRLVFEMYDAVVPYHHEEYLQNIPQYVALFHNNCMYLAHNFLMFGDKWLVLMEGRNMDYPISFIDLVPKLRELGYKHLVMHMQQQRKQILDNIRASDLNCIVVQDVLGDNAEAAIRQCLRQLQLLKNVWIGVFPPNVFTRLMATLVNMFVDELIHRICTVEDISMEMATQLTDMYTLVIQKVPHLFKIPTDVEEHIKPWLKLKELIFILSGSLKDIENHWNDGNGPLAKHFRTEEIRNLIKALFQNTQFRANLLSKIK